MSETLATERYLRGPYEEYIHMSRYSRWREDLGRRETWPESVERYVTFVTDLAARSPGAYRLTEPERGLIRTSILEQRAMCSMRALMTAGEAAWRDNVSIYNCTALTIDHPRAFDEMVYLLMCGTGVGFSVERQHIRKLPEVPDRLFPSDDVLVVGDSRRHWASAFRRLLGALWAGHVPRWDTSRVRPAGTSLRTFGGVASGPGPLEDLFRHTIEVFRQATGRRLTSIECHSIACKIGEVVQSGGRRRSAMLSHSNPSDERMRDAKSGSWFKTDPHFSQANNSAVWDERPDAGRFMREWLALHDSKSGERGIVNRSAMRRRVANGRRDPDHEFLVNPCAEIVLRPMQCCNLTEIVARPDDTLDDLRDKARAATIMGTLQATCTDFEYLRSVWQENCEEERLLGVSITGELDHSVFRSYRQVEASLWKQALREEVLATNEEWADRLGINVAAAATTQKPSGTVSQLVDSSSGGHPRYSPYYLRRTRDSKLDPVAKTLMKSGIPHEDDSYDSNMVVFEWPKKAPDGALTTDDMPAIEQLERWLSTSRDWCEHNASCTIQVGDDEWLAVGAWVFEHFDEVSGLSFLPRTGHVYRQAPYEAITADVYEELAAAMPSIDWQALLRIETTDRTTGSQEAACTNGTCEL